MHFEIFAVVVLLLLLNIDAFELRIEEEKILFFPETQIFFLLLKEEDSACVCRSLSSTSLSSKG
jgi:hypothetical protein